MQKRASRKGQHEAGRQALEHRRRFVTEVPTSSLDGPREYAKHASGMPIVVEEGGARVEMVVGGRKRAVAEEVRRDN